MLNKHYHVCFIPLSMEYVVFQYHGCNFYLDLNELSQLVWKVVVFSFSFKYIRINVNLLHFMYRIISLQNSNHPTFDDTLNCLYKLNYTLRRSKIVLSIDAIPSFYKFFYLITPSFCYQ